MNKIKKKYLGVNLGEFDSSVSLISEDLDGKFNLKVAQVDRLTQKKYAGFFPLSKFVPKLESFIPSVKTSEDKTIRFTMYGKRTEKLFELARDLIKNNPQSLTLKTILPQTEQSIFIGHHDCHVHSVMPFISKGKSIVLVIDGIGSSQADIQNSKDKNLYYSFEDTSIYLADDTNFKCISKTYKKSMNTGPTTLFEKVSKYIFGSIHESGKVMGLAGYSTEFDLIDNSYIENLESLSQSSPSIEPIDNLDTKEFLKLAKMAQSTQKYYETFIFNLIEQLRHDHPDYRRLVIVGGAGLNCVLNGKIVQKRLFDEVFIPPWPNDIGTSIGAAIAGMRAENQDLRELIVSPFLGEYALVTPTEMKKLDNYKVSNITNINNKILDELSNDKIVGIYLGRAEVGPRALGNRSIFASCQSRDIVSKLNVQIKLREKFRPYGVICTEEDAQKYFDLPLGFKSPYMSFALKMRMEYIKDFEHILHADDTIRIQTVNSVDNKQLYDLLIGYKGRDLGPFLINTSFNLKGFPIVSSLEDCLKVIDKVELDGIITSNFYIERKIS